MIANYTNHAANERAFLARIRTGLAVAAAFGFFLINLNIFVDAVGGEAYPIFRRKPPARGSRSRLAMPDWPWLGSELPSSHEAAPPLCARGARSTAMKLSRSRSSVRRRCSPRRLRSPC
jgi:hypothetical protein